MFLSKLQVFFFFFSNTPLIPLCTKMWGHSLDNLWFVVFLLCSQGHYVYSSLALVTGSFKC